VSRGTTKSKGAGGLVTIVDQSGKLTFFFLMTFFLVLGR
jgi:hypothetical protein